MSSVSYVIRGDESFKGAVCRFLCENDPVSRCDCGESGGCMICHFSEDRLPSEAALAWDELLRRAEAESRRVYFASLAVHQLRFANEREPIGWFRRRLGWVGDALMPYATFIQVPSGEEKTVSRDPSQE